MVSAELRGVPEIPRYFRKTRNSVEFRKYRCISAEFRVYLFYTSILLEVPSKWYFRDRGISGNSAVSGSTAVAETRLERHLQQYRKGKRETPRSSGKPWYFQNPRPRYFRKPQSSAPTNL